MSKKILAIQSISCHGASSITASLPILSSFGIEAAILPTCIKASNNQDVIVDLTDEMPKIINHWIDENIKFDAIYTSNINDYKQADYVLKCKEYLLNPNGILFVDPQMGDSGTQYVNNDIFYGLKKICMDADYLIPNVTSACLLTDIEYKDIHDSSFINELLSKLIEIGPKQIILTSVMDDEDSIGAIGYDGFTKTTIIKELIEKSYHGTKDIFSSIVLADILNGKSMKDTLDHATDFILDSITDTMDDNNHDYALKFEHLLK
ncbi:MAG: bifunctional hydroxymethylpyrimidine kinase/phosphomethylpyrimidine kinase [Acholeplasmatales bacterium]|nr:bifunctional hydroxymethylpyrimidine kinase/phosphomethylpyrimidine kinase [Acholeplasmatales bacterium]